mgnify:CR=1 FL=1
MSTSVKTVKTVKTVKSTTSINCPKHVLPARIGLKHGTAIRATAAGR